MAVISALLSLGAGIISILFRVVVALIVGVAMTAKGRKGLWWGIAALIFPYIIFLVFIIPRKVPKLNGAIRNHEDFVGLDPMVASIMALAAMVAKADGRVTKEEIQVVRNFVTRQFALPSSSLNGYESAFNYGKDHPQDYHYFTELIRSHNRYNVTMSVSYLLMGMVLKNGSINHEEEVLVKQIILGLGLSDYEYMSIKRHLASGRSDFGGSSHGAGSGYRQRYGQYGGMGNMPREDLTKKYAQVLGVSPDADMGTIKKAYRKLAKENHPDKLAGEGMPDDYVQYANQRISEINEAYEYLKKIKEAA